MKNAILFSIFILSMLISFGQSKTDVFVETESFNELGGWVVDNQFVLQMGSPYLLAHGMGKPVENAKTVVEFSNTGKYHTWVRTKNWVPGNWQAPGRFRLIINQIELPKDLGTETGWNWQYAGEIEIKKKSATIELKDLTGFDGRCDAIYFTMSNNAPPPNDMKQLSDFRNKLIYAKNDKIDNLHFDLVVVGGGTAGCGAAIAAAEQGLKVALIQDRPMLGGNASAEVRVHTLGIKWKYDRILSMVDTEHWPNGSHDAKKDQEKRHKNIAKYKNIHLYLNCKAIGAKTTNDSIEYIETVHAQTQKRINFHSGLFVDCTGDGWLGFWSGAKYMYGREDSTVFNEQFSEIKKSMHSHFFKNDIFDSKGVKQLLIPDKTDSLVMGTTVLWMSKISEKESTFPLLPWAQDVAKDYVSLNGEWYWEYSSGKLHQIHDAEEIRDYLLRAIYGTFSNAKQDDLTANRELDWVAYVMGKRESRRIVGDYIYTLNDALQNRKFEDSVVMETRQFDIHCPQNLFDIHKPDFLSDALYVTTKPYYLPYRSLYSKSIKNLFMAGRCFSSSHLGLGGPRVMNTTGQMGCAVGYAAALCKKNKVNPRDIFKLYLQDLLKLVENSNSFVPTY